MSREDEELHRQSRARALRTVMGDGLWHENTELARRVGHRFGDAIFRVRRGTDGGPAWFVAEQQLTGDGRLWRYRFVGVNPEPPKAGDSWRARALRAERKLRELGLSP